MKLSREEATELKVALEDGHHFPEWLIDWALNKYSEDMSYGTITGDTGVVDEWLSDNVDLILDSFEEDLKSVSWNGNIA